jgi:hypothetical protein
MARGECDDLRREVAALRRDLAARNAQVHRLNALLVKHEETIDALEKLLLRLTSPATRLDLASAQRNNTELPY